ncbi:hypothetical protein GVX81_09050 [[Haemophilus] felis]|uniref:Uncharacterized protein n=1 Tax=[Haemophilus] felis TaxID=123822 RepID=A0A1T0AVX7_9PAST|nr:hypothetical protein [[Haemophilus] felis]OOS01135.1 hypothetical protein B0188_10130 [[Haemophilus] felis]
MSKVYRLEVFNADHELEHTCDYSTIEQAEKVKQAMLSKPDVLKVELYETTEPKPQGYNVVLVYQDGSQFICAEGVTLARALRIKSDIRAAQANNDFSYLNVSTISIVKGGNDE